MPASMIMAETGSSVNEIGSSIATVVTGPIPGNTPTSVPSNTPTKQYKRFWKVSATSKPSAMLERRSTPALLQRRPDRQRQAQAVDKDADRERRKHQRQCGEFHRPRLAARQRRHPCHDDQRDHQAEALDEGAEQTDAKRDDGERQHVQPR